VDHDILLARIGLKVKDKRLKRLIPAYLRSGVKCADGLRPSDKGTPQGGPLSPLLSNILLDDLDKELERRGHCFCRYADDFQIYVRTQRAGERVLRSITGFVEGLKLKVNRAKSAVSRPWQRTFLGFTFIKVFGVLRVHLPEKTLQRFRSRLKRLFRMGRGRNVGRFIRDQLNPVLRGWIQYFALGASRGILATLDFWIRRRLRCLVWRQWKRPRTRLKRLVSLGIPQEQATTALNRRGPWKNSALPALTHALSPSWFRHLELYGLRDHLLRREQH
jgi:RNA-directed DNA polymerase